MLWIGFINTKKKLSLVPLNQYTLNMVNFPVKTRLHFNKNKLCTVHRVQIAFFCAMKLSSLCLQSVKNDMALGKIQQLYPYKMSDKSRKPENTSILTIMPTMDCLNHQHFCLWFPCVLHIQFQPPNFSLFILARTIVRICTHHRTWYLLFFHLNVAS